MKVVRIDLVFDNAKIINLLIKRGTAIRKCKKELVRKLEHQIHEEKKRQYYANICGVFITLENDEDVKNAFELCSSSAHANEQQLFGKPITYMRPKEPSNYIWENMAFTSKRKKIYFFIIMCVIGLLLFLAYKI